MGKVERLEAELTRQAAENAQLRAAMTAIAAALAQFADAGDYPAAVGAVRGILARLADGRPIVGPRLAEGR